MKEWLSIAARRDIVTRAVKVGAIVGTILVLINQGNLLLEGELTAQLLAKILLTYCVPYSVSTYASVEAVRNLETTE